jgi:hypothetical protein
VDSDDEDEYYGPMGMTFKHWDSMGPESLEGPIGTRGLIFSEISPTPCSILLPRPPAALSERASS